MGKKARMRRYPQKFGRKFASHPYMIAQAKLREVKEEAMADGVITPEEQVKIAEAEAVVESLTPVLDAVEETTTPEPSPPPAPVVEAPVATKKPKPRRTTTKKKPATRRRTTRKKPETKE